MWTIANRHSNDDLDVALSRAHLGPVRIPAAEIEGKSFLGVAEHDKQGFHPPRTESDTDREFPAAEEKESLKPEEQDVNGICSSCLNPFIHPPNLPQGDSDSDWIRYPVSFNCQKIPENPDDAASQGKSCKHAMCWDCTKQWVLTRTEAEQPLTCPDCRKDLVPYERKFAQAIRALISSIDNYSTAILDRRYNEALMNLNAGFSALLNYRDDVLLVVFGFPFALVLGQFLHFVFTAITFQDFVKNWLLYFVAATYAFLNYFSTLNLLIIYLTMLGTIISYLWEILQSRMRVPIRALVYTLPRVHFLNAVATSMKVLAVFSVAASHSVSVVFSLFDVLRRIA